MNHYEIYPGGVIAGEVVISTRRPMRDDGTVLMTEDEYNTSFGGATRRQRGNSSYHEGYDASSHGGLVLLHPKRMHIDRVAALLHDAGAVR